MPALVQGGPKLPSFQKLKTKKRARPEPTKEDKHAPQAKKPASGAHLTKDGSFDSEVKKEKPRKAQKKNAWNNRMAEQRKERLKKKSQPESSPAPAARTKPAPGSNWQQLKVCIHPIPLVL